MDWTLGLITPRILQKMNFIQEIVRKYKGEYTELDKREFHTPEGKYATQFQEGIIIVDEIKFSISQNKSVGINFNSVAANEIYNEPIRIFLHLEKDEKTLYIYPKNIVQKAFYYIKNGETDNQFVYKGKNKVIKQLKQNKELIKKLKDESLYISISEKYPSKIMITPRNGIEDSFVFEKYIEILKIISSKIKKPNNT